jgi:hypothetical protein
MYSKSFSINPRKININKNITKHSLLKEKSYFRSYHKNKKKELKLPDLKKSFNIYNKTRSKSLYYNNKANKKISFKYSKLFPTSINDALHRNDNNIKTSKTNGSLTESNLNNLEQNINIKPTKKFRQYKKFFETSSLINNQGANISNDIKNNPFMRKIEDLNKINQFEIIFHNNIMQNIKAVYGKNKKGFFKIEHTTKSKDAIGTGYICENDNNIFSVSDMIERMNPISTLKFSNLLRKDYKEFLGYEYKKKKNKKDNNNNNEKDNNNNNKDNNNNKKDNNNIDIKEINKRNEEEFNKKNFYYRYKIDTNVDL